MDFALLNKLKSKCSYRWWCWCIFNTGMFILCLLTFLFCFTLKIISVLWALHCCFLVSPLDGIISPMFVVSSKNSTSHNFKTLIFPFALVTNIREASWVKLKANDDVGQINELRSPAMLQHVCYSTEMPMKCKWWTNNAAILASVFAIVWHWLKRMSFCYSHLTQDATIRFSLRFDSLCHLSLYMYRSAYQLPSCVLICKWSSLPRMGGWLELSNTVEKKKISPILECFIFQKLHVLYPNE